jgi:cytidylate kinase
MLFAEMEASVDYRVLTVSREFGSGGGRIAKIVAEKLGWKLLDRELIEEIANAARVDPRIVTKFDERPESWMGRMNRRAMQGAALAAGVAPEEENCFDCDVMADLTRKVIERAHKKGDCVIVGRGAQCILQHPKDVFHVFVYAPFHERVSRLRNRLEKGVNIEERIHAVDGARAQYLKQFYGKVWNDRHLYDLMISSSEDEEATANVILAAMKAPRATAAEKREVTASR